MEEIAPIIFSVDSHPLIAGLCKSLNAEAGLINVRSFPDGESYIRIESSVKGRQCMIVADLSHPNSKFLPMIFLSATLKELGAKSVGLVAPYLSYMRQDRRFIEGEAITSRIFAQLLSKQVDWLVTVDPHLHRYDSLDEIYEIPTRVVQGAPILAEWLSTRQDVFLVGPDAESEQWVSKIAARSNHSFIIGEKQRLGDREVVVTLPDISEYKSLTAVIIDDVISSGHTVLECIKALQLNGVENIICACVHGIFENAVDKVLLDRGLQLLVTSNTIVHSSNQLDVTSLLTPAIRECLLFSKGESA